MALPDRIITEPQCLSGSQGTLIDLLRWRALQQPTKLAYSFLLDGETKEVSITYDELDRKARAIAVWLQRQGITDHRVMLFLPPGLEYIAGFFGCMYAGAVPVPAFPPRHNRHLSRLQLMASDCQAAAALTTDLLLSRSQKLLSDDPALKSLRWLAIDGVNNDSVDEWQHPGISPDDLAFLQYTSGSTSDPKGVMVTHRNLLHNQSLIQKAFKQTEQSVILGWLPLHHDMGLIGNVLQPLYLGAPSVLMSPVAFLQRPLRWLQAISRYKATTSGGPNFAYDLCVKRIKPEHISSLNLSSWSVAFNGSEPIRSKSMTLFTEAFESCGFRPQAFYPCYGLAEATLLVSAGSKHTPPLTAIAVANSQQYDLVVDSDDNNPGTLQVVSCGEVLTDQQVVIVNPETRIAGLPGHVGEIWVRGPSVTSGYWNKLDETERIFQAKLEDTGEGPYLRTGDLGFLSQGQLFVTGRLKDLIIIRGFNHYPQDIELTVGLAHPALKNDSGAAFSIEDSGEERLVIVNEVDSEYVSQADAIIDSIRRTVAEQHEVQTHKIVLIRPGTIPKTSSGKIRRQACRESFLSRTLEILAESITTPSALDETYEWELNAFLQSPGDIENWLISRLARKLRRQPGELDPSLPLAYYGLDSLMLMELMHSAENHLGISLPIESVFSTRTISQLAHDAFAQSADARSNVIVTGTAVDQNLTEYPLSYGQQALWFLQRMAPENSAYNIAGAARISGDLHTDLFRQAFEILANRHRCLRTTFEAVSGDPIQRVLPNAEISFSIIDASEWSEATLRTRLAEEAHRPFDLEKDSLLRVVLYRRSDSEHIALLIIHHIISDLWSLSVLLQELATVYESRRAGRAADLDLPEVHYSDFVRWQTEMLSGQEGERLWSYWQKQLAGQLPALSLPFGRPRPPVQTFKGASESLFLSASLTEQVKALTQSKQTTLFVTLLSAFQALLHRYSGQDDLLIGSPMSGRTRPEFAPLIGYFVNPVVLRADLSADPTGEELIDQTGQTVLGALAHQEYPLALLAERLHPKRDASRLHLAQAWFVLQRSPSLNQAGGGEDMDLAPFALGNTPAVIRFGGLTVESMPLERQSSQFDLTLTMAESGDALTASLQYNTDLFDATTMRRMLGHFQILLQSMISNPAHPISALPLLTEAELRMLLSDWSLIEEDFLTQLCIHQVFELQAEKSPEAIALQSADERLTYGELNRRANQLAHYLVGAGVSIETRVGICLNRSIGMIVAIFGVLKAGGAYAPIDPAYPLERRDFIIADAGIGLLITEEKLAPALAEPDVRLICIDTDWELISKSDDRNPRTEVKPENIAYLIYTSGSTGKPKGALITHQNVDRLFKATESIYGFNANDVWTLFHSYTFDFSVWELFGALLYGGRLVIVSHRVSRSPEEFHTLLCEENVTILNQTPSVFRQLIRVDETAANRNGLSLRFVIFGGEALDFQILKPWFDYHGDKIPQLVNMYGITETTVHVTYRGVAESDLSKGSRSNIGRPISDLQVYLLDPRLQPAPVGIPGEMYIGGAGLSRGYLNRPNLTAERFIPNPFSAEPGHRLYKSGDMAHYLQSAEIDYLGRIDHQEKIRGLRIEMGEIEATLHKHPAIREAVVIARSENSIADNSRDHNNDQKTDYALRSLRSFLASSTTGQPAKEADKRLVAYVVCDKEEKPNISELRAFVKDKLPEYMVPASFVMMDSIPLTATGKIDRRALPLPERSRPELEEPFVAPRTKVERELAAIWCQVMGLEQAGIDDDFFALGGDSIRSIKVQTLALERGLRFSIDDLFRFQSIRELAQIVEEREPHEPLKLAKQPFSLISNEDRARLSDDAEDAYPLSMLQAGIIYHTQFNPGASFYHDIFLYHLRVRFDLGVITRVLQRLADRHQILRTSIHLTGFSESLQIVNKKCSIPVKVEELRGLSEEVQREKIQTWIDEEKRNPIDLGTPPLLRFFVHRLTDETLYITLSFSPTILDGWSAASFLTEFLELYCLMLEGRNSLPQPSPAITYRDFIEMERSAIASEESRNFWAGKLEDCVITKLPRLPVAGSACGISEVGVVTVPLSSAVSEGLNRLADLAGVSIKHVLLAAHLRVMNFISGQPDVMTGIEANGRLEEAGGDKSLGLHLNTLPFRLKLTGGTWVDLVKKVFETERDFLPFRRYPYAEIQRVTGGQPLFETGFNYTHFHVFDRLLSLASLEILGGRGYEHTHFTLKTEFNRSPFSDDITLELECNLNEIDAAQAAGIARYYERVLQAMACEPLARYELICPLAPEEQKQLLIDWSSRPAEYPTDKFIADLFEEQASLSPHKVAVECVGESISYAELNRRANHLANYLIENGIGPESVTGVCIDRSLEMVTALLGILKAGGAFLPLEPSHPTERLAFMIDEWHPHLVLTKQHLVEKLRNNAVSLVCLDADWKQISSQSEQNPVSRISGENSAYVVSTSGSTGHPKGVIGLHQGILNRLYWMWEEFPYRDDEVCCQKTSLSFADSICEIFGPLVKGVRLVVITEEVVKDPRRLVTTLFEGGVTRLVLVPSLLRAMLGTFRDLQHQLPMLKYWVTSGEALTLELSEQFHRAMPESRLLNFYGSSEVSADSTWYDTLKTEPRSSVPIGIPLSNMEVYILDEHMQLVPPMVIGELYAGGVGLARGYLDRPDLTAEKFIPNPASTRAGERLYNTGDLSRYLPDGNIEFFGRADHQMKIRGYRIEAVEIERTLATHPAIREAVILAKVIDQGDKQLVAYIQKNTDDDLSVSEIHGFLKGRLPEYMVPSLYVSVEQMPRTVSGKVDRKRLPEIGGEKVALGRKYVAPRTADEELLAYIWAEVLKMERVGIYDLFTELGGHSLLAVNLISRIREALAVDIALKDLYESQSVEGLAKLIRGLSGRDAEYIKLPDLEIDIEHRSEPFPLTDVQEAYWIGRSASMKMGNVGSHFYVEIEVEGLDVGRLQSALNRLIERHEMLRAVVLEEGQQQILSSVPLYEIETLDLRANDSDSSLFLLQTVREQMSHKFNAANQWPLFELRASLLSHQRARLHFSLDLLIADAWSMQILLSELFNFYNSPEFSPSPLELSFRDYVLAERKTHDTDLYQRAKRYWLERLPSLPAAPELPFAQSPSTLTLPRFNRRSDRIEQEKWARIKKQAARLGLTPSTVLMTAFSVVLGRWSRSQQFTINLTLYNRLPLHPQVNDVVGDFTSLSMLACDNSQEGTFESRARQIQKQLWDDLDHRYFGGVRVLRELARIASSPQAAVMPVVFTSAITPGIEAKDSFSISSVCEVGYSVSQTPQVWLDNQVMEQDGALLINWDVVEELFPEGIIEDMFSSYCGLLNQLIENEEIWHENKLELLPPVQIQRRGAANDTDWIKTDELLHTRFNEQAMNRPDQLAVITSEVKLSYKDLYHKANQLGHTLRRLGAQPNNLVAVVMEKGWEQIVAVVGILQSGAAYLPIDAGLPEERIKYLLDNGRVNLAVTQAEVDRRLSFPPGVRSVVIDGPEVLKEEISELEAIAKPDDLAYVIYTSGSTGDPKGVMIEHRGAVNTILDLNDRYSVGSNDRIFAISSLSFDLSVYDIFGMLAAGGTIVIAEGERNPALWAEQVRREEVTIWNSVPALMDMLVEYEEVKGGSDLNSLRLAFLSGDWIGVTLPDRLRSLAKDVRVISMGGATEGSIWSILYEVGEVGAEFKSIPYGKAMRNQRMYVLGPSKEECPDGVVGEIYIGGIGLARGYWKDEQKTSSRFIDRAGERLYRTGDMGRYRRDGNIEFLGREDNQIKVNGYRVELGEIESSIRKYAGVREAVVKATGERAGHKSLVAYLVEQESGAVNKDDLREYLSRKLPDYMVPRAYVKVDKLPLTANGKVDLKRLPDLAMPSSQNGAELHKENNYQLQPILSHIGRLVESVLKLKVISPETNLLDLGASSVDAVRIANLLEKELNFRPGIEDFYWHPTITGLTESYLQHLRNGLSGARSAESNGSEKLSDSFTELLDPADRQAFKKQQNGLRRDAQNFTQIALEENEADAALTEQFLARRSHRLFSLQSVGGLDFSRLLGCLRQITIDEKPKFMYPSAGGIYAIQTYLHIKPARVDGLQAGTYYYDPSDHKLLLLSPRAEIDRSIHEPFVNRPAFDEAAFSIFLIAKLNAVTSMYGELARDFCLLEAGYMSQLLMMSAPSNQIGLCPIGIIDFKRIRDLFVLEDDHLLLHSLLGGRVGNIEADADTEGFNRQSGVDKAARMLDRIKQLSEEEVRALLSADVSIDNSEDRS